jgi:hypothetical protein
MWSRRVAVALAALFLGACGEDGIGWLSRPLGAVCQVSITGIGTRPVETDYIPHVVACENGSADTEALKAQAVSARSYMYYRVLKSGSICDGTSCQVYTCKNKPQAKHYAAAKATAGQVLMWGGVVICAFYVAGAKPSTASCQAASGDPDPTSTEKYVTYNAGKSGSGITQSTLGWVSPTNKYNRGCKSQNGAHCLSLKGKPYPQILRFYYGDDIQLVTAQGPCVSPPQVDAGHQPDSVVHPGQDASRDVELKHDSEKHRDGWRPVDGLPPVQPPPSPQSPNLSGGCSMGDRLVTARAWPAFLLPLVLLVWRRRGGA